jgi:ferredoxin-type protein NapH
LPTGKLLLALSVVTRFSTVLLLCCLAMWTEYLNLKVGYNHPRLVELSSGRAMRLFYEASEWFFGLLGDPLVTAQSNAGMTWSIRILGVPFTNPVALSSMLVAEGGAPLGFIVGAVVPLATALLLGRVFCSYVCPASLLFFTIGRVRRALGPYLYFPDVHVGRGAAWGVLLGGLALAAVYGHGVWTLILPYFAMGQTIFHGIALGVLSVSVASLLLFVSLDLFVGYRFTCRNLCPTGRLLGAVGRRPLVSVRRQSERCVDRCTSCADVCPFEVDPKADETRDCSLCGACLVICPTQCLSVGRG